MNKILYKVFKHKIILLILLLSFILRIYDINNNPKAMYGDELTLVYDAYSILKTGQDQSGEFLPVFFSMGGGRPPLYIYATIPFVALFGPTALAARSVSVLSGIGVVILLYLICDKLLNKKVALYSALLASITPWELNLSRGGFESHFALFLSLFGLYSFFRGKTNHFWYFVSGLSFALSMQTYSTYVLTIPFFTILLLIFNGTGNLKQAVKPGILFFLALILSSLLFSVYISLSRGTKDRFTNLYIFNKENLQSQLAVKVRSDRAYSLLDKRLAIKFHNRYLENLNVFIENYMNNFGLNFLFLQGDRNPRHNPALMGQLFFFCLPLLIIGSIKLQKNKKRVFQFVLFWILVAPIAASLVGEAHALRNSFMLPPILILCALGIPSSKKMKIVLLTLFLTQLPFFINRFYFLSPNLNARFWSYSAKIASGAAFENKAKYDFVFLSTSIPDLEFAYPVYARLEPKKVIDQRLNRTKLDEYKLLKFDNVYLGTIPGTRVRDFMKSLNGSVFYLGPIEDQGLVDNEKIQRDENEQPLFVISSKK